jgi:hypothetical protein
MAAAHPPVIWRWVICDLNGVAISIITGITDEIELTFSLNRPAELTFTVPSDNPLVNTLHTDSAPYLSCGDRVIKGYRKVSSGEDITPAGWVIGYVGRTYIVDDAGDGDTVRTSVTCYDPLIDLATRLVRNSSGSFASTVSFTSTTLGNIIKAMIDRSNTYAAAATMLSTAGTWADVATRSEDYDLAYILTSMNELTDTALVDLVTSYLDSTTGVHMELGSASAAGSDVSGSVILGYDAPPRNSAEFARTQTMETFANDVTLFPAKRATGSSAGTNPTSITRYGAFESAEVLTDINNLTLLDDLSTEQLALRSKPKDVVSLTPAPELAALPITD